MIATPGFMLKLTKIHARGLLNLIAIDEVWTLRLKLQVYIIGFMFSTYFCQYFRHIASHLGAMTSGDFSFLLRVFQFIVTCSCHSAKKSCISTAILGLSTQIWELVMATFLKPLYVLEVAFVGSWLSFCWTSSVAALNPVAVLNL